MTSPHEFWDNRIDKKNPKYPDFKQKNGDGALWLSSAPDWFKLPEKL